MQTSAELKNLLQRIDHKGYPAYKDTRGSYEFPGYRTSWRSKKRTGNY